jgi:hypothetical protein
MQVLCSVLCDVCDGQEIDTVSTDVLARSTLLRDAKPNNCGLAIWRFASPFSFWAKQARVPTVVVMAASAKEC